MEITALMGPFTGSDPQAQEIGDALVELGEPTATPVLAVLRDETSPVDRSTSAGVLALTSCGRIHGPPRGALEI